MKVITTNLTGRIVKEIRFQTDNEKHIAYAEKQKARLENEGFTFVKENAGFNSASLIYRKAV